MSTFHDINTYQFSDKKVQSETGNNQTSRMQHWLYHAGHYLACQFNKINRKSRSFFSSHQYLGHAKGVINKTSLKKTGGLNAVVALLKAPASKAQISYRSLRRRFGRQKKKAVLFKNFKFNKIRSSKRINRGKLNKRAVSHLLNKGQAHSLKKFSSAYRELKIRVLNAFYKSPTMHRLKTSITQNKFYQNTKQKIASSRVFERIAPLQAKLNFNGSIRERISHLSQRLGLTALLSKDKVSKHSVNPFAGRVTNQFIPVTYNALAADFDKNTLILNEPKQLSGKDRLGAKGQETNVKAPRRKLSKFLKAAKRQGEWLKDRNLRRAYAAAKLRHQYDRAWAQPINLPADKIDDLAGWRQARTLPEWEALGIIDANGRSFPRLKTKTALIFPQGAEGPAFLVIKDFKNIVRYNSLKVLKEGGRISRQVYWGLRGQATYLISQMRHVHLPKVAKFHARTKSRFVKTHFWQQSLKQLQGFSFPSLRSNKK